MASESALSMLLLGGWCRCGDGAHLGPERVTKTHLEQVPVGTPGFVL